MKDVNLWTRKEFEALPERPSWDTSVECRAIVILPTRRLHDSGYRSMDFVACTKDGPVCRLSGCSDVIHIDGIGGRGKYGRISDTTIPKGWSMDCLKTSGLLRLFCGHHELTAGPALSSFEIYATERP